MLNWQLKLASIVTPWRTHRNLTLEHSLQPKLVRHHLCPFLFLFPLFPGQPTFCLYRLILDLLNQQSHITDGFLCSAQCRQDSAQYFRLFGFVWGIYNFNRMDMQVVYSLWLQEYFLTWTPRYKLLCRCAFIFLESELPNHILLNRHTKTLLHSNLKSG